MRQRKILSAFLAIMLLFSFVCTSVLANPFELYDPMSIAVSEDENQAIILDYETGEEWIEEDTSQDEDPFEANPDKEDEFGEYTTNRFIVRYRSEKGRKDVISMIGEWQVDAKIKDKNFDVIITNELMTLDSLLLEISSKGIDKHIQYIHPDYELTPASVDPLINEQWGLLGSTLPISSLSIQEDLDTVNKAVYQDVYDQHAMIQKIETIGVDAIGAWEESEGEGVIVTVLDTGIDIMHEDLSENIWVNTGEIPGNGIDDDGNGYVDDYYAWNFCDNTDEVYKEALAYDSWHGTRIAGIIAASKDNGKGIAGVAPSAKIMPLKVFKNGIAYTSDVINAIIYASKMGSKVANCSWSVARENLALKEVMENTDMLFVVAAGNDNIKLDRYPVYPACFKSDNIITVASIDRYGNLSGFSNYGENMVDVAAPGEDILSTHPGNRYYEGSGTSMSCAFVSGQAALILSKYKNMVSRKVKERIITSCDQLSSLIGLVNSGNIINCYNSVAPDNARGRLFNVISRYENNTDEDNYITSEWVSIDENEILSVSQQVYNEVQEQSPFSIQQMDTELQMTNFSVESDYWLPKANMNVKRGFLGTVEVNGKIYAIGGRNTQVLNTVEEYDPVLNRWTMKASMPTPRKYLGVTVINGKIYAIGGYNFGVLNRVEEYDPVTDTWKMKANMPTARASLGVAAYNGIIYAIGGSNDKNLATVETYDPVSNKWTSISSMTFPRKGVSAVVANGKIYAIGGKDKNTSLAIVEEYNAGGWRTKANMPTPRVHFGTAEVNGKIYAIGGYDGLTNLSTVEEYDPVTDQWQRKTDMPTTRRGVGLVVVNGKIYAIGGANKKNFNIVEEYNLVRQDGDSWSMKGHYSDRYRQGVVEVNGKIYEVGGRDDGGSLSSVYEYNPLSNQRLLKASMPTSRRAFGVAAVNGKIYAIGGYDGRTNLSTVEEYDPTTSYWIRKSSMPTPRRALGAVAVNGKIYAIGGENSETLATVEEYDPITNSWTTKASLPTPNKFMGVTAANGKIYVVGGVDNLKRTLEYDPVTDRWISRANMPTARSHLTAAAVNGKIYAIGGGSQRYFNTVEQYDPALNQWTTKASLLYARGEAGSAAANGRIYVIGGQSEEYWELPIEEYSPDISNDDHGYNFDTATTISVEEEMPGAINFGGDEDYFRFTAPENGSYTFYSTGTTNICASLYDFNKNELMASDKSEIPNFKIECNLVRSQVYYIKVQHKRLREIGTYTLFARFNDQSTYFNQAMSISVNENIPASINTAYDSNYFKFVAPVSGNYLINTAGSNDSCGYLYSSQYTLLAQNDNISSEDLNFGITYPLVAGSTYYIRAIYNNDGIGPYILRVSADNYGNGFLAAFPIQTDSQTYGAIEYPGDEDYFKFTVPIGGTYTIETMGKADTHGTLYDSNYVILAENDNVGGADKNFSIFYNLLGGQTYYVKVRHSHDLGIGSYMLRVFKDDHGSSFNYYTTIQDGSYINGTIEHEGDEDYFKFTASTGVACIIRTTGITDTYGALYDSNYMLLAENDDTGASDKNFSITYNLTAGEVYYVKVRHSNNISVGSYALKLNLYNTVPVKANEPFEFIITGANITSFSSYTFCVSYDPNKVEILDLCSATPQADTTVGSIPGANIIITQYTPGVIKFTVTRSIASNKDWSGAINTIKFLSKIIGDPNIVVTVE